MKVDLILQGHEHSYMRSRPLTINKDCPAIDPESYNSKCTTTVNGSNYLAGTGSILVINGTGGQTLRPIKRARPAKPYFAYWSGSNSNPTHGLLLVHITPSSLRAFYLRNQDGQVMDGFSITH
jgi:hypothetical protein